MTTQDENELFTPDEQDWINYVRTEYVRKYLPGLLNVGVSFSPEQEEKIRGLHAAGNIQEVQKLILDNLRTEIDDKPENDIGPDKT